MKSRVFHHLFSHSLSFQILLISGEILLCYIIIIISNNKGRQWLGLDYVLTARSSGTVKATTMVVQISMSQVWLGGVFIDLARDSLVMC